MGNQTLGRGELHFSLFKAGTYEPAGFRYFGNTPEFSLSNEVDTLDHYDSDHGIKEKDLSVALQSNRSGSFTCDDISMENIALFFFGSSSVIAQAALAGQSETFAGVVPGMSYQVGISSTKPVGVRALTSVVVKIGAVVKVAGLDYVVDVDRAIVTVLKGGSIIAGNAMIVEYALLARNVSQVVSGNVPIEGCLQFRSFNPVGEKMDYIMRYVQISANGDFALKSDDWQTMPFNVEILKAPGLQAVYVNGQPFI